MAQPTVDLSPILKTLAPLFIIALAVSVLKALFTPTRKRRGRRSPRNGGAPLVDLMAAEHVEHGVFLTTSNYTEEALEFPSGKNLELVTGQQLIDFILRLKPDAQSALLATAFAGDFSTPTCPQCGVQMTEHVSGRGPSQGSTFWGWRQLPPLQAHLSDKGRSSVVRH